MVCSRSMVVGKVLELVKKIEQLKNETLVAEELRDYLILQSFGIGAGDRVEINFHDPRAKEPRITEVIVCGVHSFEVIGDHIEGRAMIRFVCKDGNLSKNKISVPFSVFEEGKPCK
jgi:hypothetical protein